MYLYCNITIWINFIEYFRRDSNYYLFSKSDYKFVYLLIKYLNNTF